MSGQILTFLKQRAGRLPCHSMLYNWSLRPAAAPDRLLMRPADPWAGSSAAGEALLQNGVFLWHGDQVAIRGGSWEPLGCPPAWMAHIHSFAWLRDLRDFAAGQKGTHAQARGLAHALVQSWMGLYKHWHALIWRPDITGQRLAFWLSFYEFFGEDVFEDPEEEEAFQDQFFDMLMRQAGHVSRALLHGLPEDAQGIGAFQAAKGLLYAGLTLEGQAHWAAQALDTFNKEIDQQILGDGMHVSRSPAQLQEVLQILLDVRMVLRTAGQSLPDKIQNTIDRIGPALRFFRYNDKHLALFHGAQEGDADLIDNILGQAGFRSKTMNSLNCAGFERITQGRTTIIMDCGGTPTRPLDARAHSAPLAFEMTYGRERLFVNCGSHPFAPEWQEALRATPAHNTLTLDHRNACEIMKDGHFGRKTRKKSSLREEARSAILLESSHDGYVPLNGFVHRRRLYLSDHGFDLRGEDTLVAADDPAKILHTIIRFHLHPKILVSLIRDGQEALLRMQGGIGWRFHFSGEGAHMSLEDSLYMGHGGQPRKTKQLAITAPVTGRKCQIKWALQREG